MRDIAPYAAQSTLVLPDERLTRFDQFPPDDSSLNLQHYWQILTKRKWQIAACFAVVVLCVSIGTFCMTPVYTASATLMIEERAPEVLDIRKVLSESLGTDAHDYYETQYEILRSRHLATQIIEEQHLQDHPVFHDVETETRTGEHRLGQLVDAYLDTLTIEPIAKTHLVRVGISTPDPELSAQLANAHIETYIQQRISLHAEATEGARRFLEIKLGALKEQVAQSEAVLNDYRRENRIISLDEKDNIVVERLADLNSRLTEAEAERVTLEARIYLTHSRAYNSIPEVVNNTLIQTLKSDLSSLEGQYAHLAAQFKPGYPRLAQLKAQVEGTRSRLQQEVRRVVGGIESAYLAAKVKEDGLRAKLEEQRAVALSLKDASVEYAILAREVEAQRQFYDVLLRRVTEIRVAAGLPTSKVQILDRATPPRYPSQPKKKLNLLLGALVGLVGGIGLAFVFEYFDTTLKTPETVEHYLHLPSLSVVPDFVSIPHKQPQLPALTAESYRLLRTALLLSPETAPKIILLTSGKQAEGKTATTVNTAMMFAQMGVKVLIIDADLRRPACHLFMNVEKSVGLSSVLMRQVELREAITPTPFANLFLLSSGPAVPNPTEIVGSADMQALLAALRPSYDYIFVDSPPVIPVSDAVILSTMVDGVVLVANARSTPKQIVKAACSRLQYAKANILGVVLNQVDIQTAGYENSYSYASDYYQSVEL